MLACQLTSCLAFGLRVGRRKVQQQRAERRQSSSCGGGASSPGQLCRRKLWTPPSTTRDQLSIKHKAVWTQNSAAGVLPVELQDPSLFSENSNRIKGQPPSKLSKPSLPKPRRIMRRQTVCGRPYCGCCTALSCLLATILRGDGKGKNSISSC